MPNMNRGAEEDQDVGRENNDGRRIEPHIHNPLLSTHTIDVSNAAGLDPEPVQADITFSQFYFMELLIPNPRHLPAPAQQDTSHGGQVAHGGRGGRPALELEDAPPSYEDVAHAHSETADPPSYEAATKSPGYNPPLFNQDIRIPVATATSDPEPTNPPAIEDESADGSRGSFVDRVCDRFSCCCQNCWQYGPVWTCVTLMLCA